MKEKINTGERDIEKAREKEGRESRDVARERRKQRSRQSQRQRQRIYRVTDR